MDSIAALRALIDRRRDDLRATLPGRGVTLPDLIRSGDALSHATAGGETTLSARSPLGWNLALRLHLEQESTHQRATASETQPSEFLRECDQLAEAALVLAQCETGYRQLHRRAEGIFDAWATTRLMPTEWRERADFDWWSATLALRAEPALRALMAERPARDPSPLPEDRYATSSPLWDYYWRLGQLHVERLAHQHSYPPDASIGGCTFRRYGEVLAALTALLLREHDRRPPGDPPLPHDEGALVAALAARLGAEEAALRQALAALTLDRGNAAYHGALPGAAAPPLVRLDSERLLLSATGLLTEPFIYLTRELRRRHAPEYHNAAHRREGVFRDDLYHLFADKRFVRSAGRIELKRTGGDARTDLDAAIFDRKTGALGLFEMKAQDPFPRSVEERLRQRDAFFLANRQVGAVADWLRRHGGDDLLNRIDPAVARRFRVQKVYHFVLGRYLAHFADGPEPDRRAAWGSWPQVLRLGGEEPHRSDAPNPLATIHARLQKDAPLAGPAGERTAQEITLGASRLTVYPSFAAYKEAVGEGRGERDDSR